MNDKVASLADHKGTGLLKYSPEVEKQIQETAKIVTECKQKNKSNSISSKAALEKLEDMGISKKAFDFILKLHTMDSTELAAIQFSLAACQEALKTKIGTIDMFPDGVDPKTGLPVTQDSAADG